MKIKCINNKNRINLQDAIIEDKYKVTLEKIKWRLENSVISKEELLKMINNVLEEDELLKKEGE